MRKIFLFAALAALLPSAAFAADCKLKILDNVHMTRATNGMDLFPVTINGAAKNFMFDTGGFYTQVSRPVAIDLNLPIHQGRIQLMSATGQISRDQASMKELTIGNMRGANVDLQVSPLNLPVDGILALDALRNSDIDLDFTTDTLRLFSEDHCPGQVVYWTTPVSAGVVPLVMDGYHAVVTVKLDGQEERAVIDTGAVGSTLLVDEAKRAFNLTMGGDDTPERGVLNGDATLKIYSHDFKTLSLGDVTVINPRLALIPNAFGRNMEKTQLVGDRTKSEKDLLNIQDMVIGMDILRKMHVYLAMGEHKMYVTSASAAAPAAPATPAPATSAPAEPASAK